MTIRGNGKFILGCVCWFLVLAAFVPAWAATRAEPDHGAAPPLAAAPQLHDLDRDGLADDLQQKLAGMSPGERVRVVVTFSGPGNADAAQRAVGPFEVRRRFKTIDGFAATMTAAQARALARVPGVFRIEEDFRVRTWLDAANADFGTAAARRDFGLSGAGVGICVVDTGVDPGHEQLDGGKVVAFADFVNSRTAPYDDHGHGTHVAAIAAGDGVPNATYGGVAPGAPIYAAKVLDASGNGIDSDVIAGVEWCASLPGVRVISLSLGSEGSSDGRDSLSRAVNSAVAAGKVAVVAAGNGGDGPQTIGSPGAAAEAVTVGAVAEWSALPGAVNHSDGVFLAPFSSRGPTADSRIKPDIVAPGVSVASARAGSVSGYLVASGTSMATPYISGTVALALEFFMLPPPKVKLILMATAQERGQAGVDNDWGAGLLDGYAFIADLMGPLAAATVFPASRRVTGSVADHGEWTWSFDVPADGLNIPLAVAVTVDGQAECSMWFWGTCWGYEWSPDLDAELVGPDGRVLAASTCPAGNECGAFGRQETLHLMPPATGTYTVRVVPYGGAPNNGKGGSFALDLSAGPLAAPNSPPLVTIASPAPGGTFQAGSPIAFAGAATDIEEGDLTANLAWASSLDGPLGSGAGFSASLSPGNHTITAEAVDSDGATGSAAVSITVTSPPTTAPTLHVGDLDATGIGLKAGQWQARVTITVHDSSHSPFGDRPVTVSYAWSGGAKGKGSCTTDSQGRCTVTSSTLKKTAASATLTVTALTDPAGILTQELSANHDPDGESNGTSITAVKP